MGGKFKRHVQFERYWPACKENRMHEAHVMQAKEPGRVPFDWSERQ